MKTKNPLEEIKKAFDKAHKIYKDKSKSYLKTIINNTWIYDTEDLQFFTIYNKDELEIEMHYCTQRQKFKIEQILINDNLINDNNYLHKYCTEQQIKKILKKYIKLSNFQ